MSKPRFKAGQNALMTVVIKEIRGRAHIIDWYGTRGLFVNGVGELICGAYDLIPAPREGEYGLTLRELADFADWYANSQFMSQVSPALYEERFGDASTSDMVKLWLKGRGKEVASC